MRGRVCIGSKERKECKKARWLRKLYRKKPCYLL